VKEFLVYSEKLTNRLTYTTRFIFQECMDLKLVVTDNLNFYRTSNLPRICYHSQRIASGIHIPDSGFLNETGIRRDAAIVLRTNKYPVLFPVKTDADFSFDLFAAVFFMISRYEEYYVLPPDSYGRFDPALSLAGQHDFLQTPVVDLWIRDLAELLKDRFPNLQVETGKFTFIPTIDIDNAWAYRHKGFLRTAGSMLRALTTGRHNELIERMKVLNGEEQDPYDTYDTIISLHKQLPTPLVFFILFARYGQFDRGINPANRYFIELIRRMHLHGKIGIHPSVRSADDRHVFHSELIGLDEVLGERILWSRQHYLRISLPATYENLIKAGINRDFSMGYASAPGFRAGTSRSFLFYNLAREEETTLRVVPFQVMDRTLKDYLGLGHQDSKDVIRDLIASVKSVNGTFCSIWHNESFSDKGEWKGWTDVYKQMLLMIQNQ
jgi:hypothetical protein